jgi:hypothetical protein
LACRALLNHIQVYRHVNISQLLLPV